VNVTNKKTDFLSVFLCPKYTGILGYWDTGILGYWDTGILGYWDTGILGYWDTGILDELLNTGLI